MKRKKGGIKSEHPRHKWRGILRGFHKKILRNEAGFTLIEIIAVIIIMGFMAAIAVPKFFSMHEDAKRATLKCGLLEASTRFSHAYARFIFDKKRAPTGIAELTTDTYLGADGAKNQGGHSIGDFKIEWRADPVNPNTIGIYITEAKTIPDMTGLESHRETKVDDITWHSP